MPDSLFSTLLPRESYTSSGRLSTILRWNGSVEEGAVVEFKDQMFVESGDENVVELMRLCLEMEEFAGQSLTVESRDDDEPSPDDLRKRFTPIKGEKGTE